MSQTRILVIRGGAIGDFILTLPALRLLRQQAPEAHLEVLGYPAIARLALESGIVDRVRSIEYAALANFFNPGIELDKELSGYFADFELVVSYLYDPDGFFHGNLARAGVRTLIPCSHRIDEEGAHAAAQLAQPLEQLALFLEDPAPALSFPRHLLERAAEFLGEALEPAPIAIHPGSGSPSKNWPLAHWLEIAQWLHQTRPGHPIVLLSGEADEEIIGPLLDFWSARSTPFRHLHGAELALVGAVASRCAFFLGHDSGISHLAAAAGAPCILLFGPTAPGIWAPQNPAVRVIASESGGL
ncbi:MAG: glycosyltransferase family 9 protein, partial [Verrucomicrobiales bacterium]